ncbi:MAG: hypothetical protein AAGF83_15115 [Cyanobacteria bacterium P01_G01_bin.67]
MQDSERSRIETAERKQLSLLVLIFASLYAFLIIVPAFLAQQFIAYPLMKSGDVLDLLTPLILIPLYWLLFKLHQDSQPNQLETLIFLLLTVIWVEGHSIHLASNSIGHLTQDIPDSEIATLTNFYDEQLSHYIWHFGIAGLSALLIYRQWRNPLSQQLSRLRWELIAGIIYGFTYFIDVIESATTKIGIPFALGVVIFSLLQGKNKICQQPILAFFLMAYALASLLFLGWGLYWGGFPEFSEIGIID